RTRGRLPPPSAAPVRGPAVAGSGPVSLRPWVVASFAEVGLTSHLVFTCPHHTSASRPRHLRLAAGLRLAAQPYSRARLRRSALPTTDSELRLMAALAHTGVTSPSAASGTASTL